MNECPRCGTTMKFEASVRQRGGCASWWHQYVWLPDIWPERKNLIGV